MDKHELSAATWTKSTYSDANGGDCIEIAPGIPGIVPVRDSKNPTGPTLLIQRRAWAAFVAAVR
jgi:uncharacterized protein DUF397